MRRSFLAPELMQISMMDCGVAALVTLMRGYGIEASYEELRRRCQTGTDGTSVDALEDIGNGLGLDLCQHLVTLDTVRAVLADRLPAIAITSNPGYPPHFVVVWRIVGNWVHVMDPSRGRYWTRLSRLQSKLHKHRQHFDSESWDEWYTNSSLRAALLAGCRRLLSADKAGEVSPAVAGKLGSQKLAAADAALRLVHQLEAKEDSRGQAWNDLVFGRAYAAQLHDATSLPSALQAVNVDETGIGLDCVVLLAPFDSARAAQALKPDEPNATSHETASAPSAAAPRPNGSTWRDVYGLLDGNARILTLAIIAGLVGLALASAVEILAYRAATEIPFSFTTFEARLGAGAVLVGLLTMLLLLDWVLLSSARALGRYLEIKLRVLTFSLLTQVDDTFIRSRPTSDLAYRAHGLAIGRTLPVLVMGSVRATLDLLITAAALIWIDRLFLATLLASLGFFWILAALANARLREIEQKFQLHGSRLLSLFLDALRGFRPLRLHGYHNAFRREHGRELRKWGTTGERQARARSVLAAFNVAVGTALVGGVLCLYVARNSDIRAFVLIAFWVLRMPALTGAVLHNVTAYPAAKAAFARILEIATYAQEPVHAAEGVSSTAPHGVALELRDAAVKLNATYLLRDINLQIPAGQHVAVVGHSGSGKSTLASLLLGFLERSEGRVLVDGEPLGRAAQESLRACTAWVDPATQLWNRSFLENLEYAAVGHERRPLLETLDASDLLPVLESLDQGLETSVGADGRLISGGEGQRLRLGRALLRSDARLVILDEPFRGLERPIRKRLAFRARLAWKRATMLFISHDIGHALDFERVLVIDGGRIVEDGHPLELATDPRTRFCQLLDAEKRMLEEVWSDRAWRRLRISDGGIRETSSS